MITKLIEGKQVHVKKEHLYNLDSHSLFTAIIAATSSCGWNPLCKNFDKFPCSRGSY